MPWEDPTYIEDFNPADPLPSDPKSQGDDHLRSIKSALQASFPNTTGAWNTADPITAGQGSEDTHVALRGDIPPPQPTLYEMSSYGRIQTASNGTAIKTSGTADWTVQYLVEGQYRVTFDQAASTPESQVVFAKLMNSGSPTPSFYGFVEVNLIGDTLVDLYGSVSGTPYDGFDISIFRIVY